MNMKALISYLLVSSLIIAGCVSLETVQNLGTHELAEETNEVLKEREDPFAIGDFSPIDENLLAVIKEEISNIEVVEEASINENPAGYRMLIKPEGYGGPVEVITFIDLEGKIAKVEIGKHNETAGVGTKVTEPAFLVNFDGISSKEELAAVDVVSGASYSSGAVKDGILSALNVFHTYLR